MLEAVLVGAAAAAVEEEEEEEEWTQARMLMVVDPSVSPQEHPGLAYDTFGKENFLKTKLPLHSSESNTNK